MFAASRDLATVVRMWGLLASVALAAGRPSRRDEYLSRAESVIRFANRYGLPLGIPN